MKSEINQIVQQLLKKDKFEQVTEQELSYLVDKYPYLSVGHLLLAKKKRENGLSDEATLQHTSLYLTNPLWGQWIYDEERFRTQKEITLIEIPSQGSPDNIDPDIVTEINIQEEQGLIKTTVTGYETKFADDDPDDTEMKEIPETDPAPLQFQSYHTVDYFASQGIKLQQADLDKDKLGQQLRSFTDWLRSMKKLPETSTLGEDDASEQTVRVIAEHSIEEKEVLTEAMAEVWKKQGNLQRARDIYHKLSLLNPSKSAYFAAKIDQL